MYPRDSRTRIGSNPLDREINCYLCQFGKIQGLENVEPARNVEVVPTVTASRTDSTADPLNSPIVDGDFEGEAGLSVCWGITPDLTANLAINPDFSRVEADVAQLDVNNQFALFFPEKRPFFLEGSDFFRTPIQAVFTRTVADPTVGAKLTGKRGNNTFGIYAAEDDITNLLFPGAYSSDSESLSMSNTALVGRYSRSFGNVSQVGALLTARNCDGYHNNVGGIDARWKINDQHTLQAQILRSDTQYPDQVAIDFDQPTDSFSGNAAQIGYNYDSRNWWTRMRFVAEYNIAHDEQGRVLEEEIESYFHISGPKQSFVQIGGLTRDMLFDGITFKENKLSVYTEIKLKGGLYLGIWARIGY